MIRLIEAATAAVDSDEFVVGRDESVGVSSYGLTGAEEITIQRKNGDQVFRDIPEVAAVLTVAAPNTKIVASGVYKISKPVTVAATGVDLD